MAASHPNRRVLEGVPRIHFFEGGKRCPEDFGLPSAVRAYAEYLGDPYVGCTNTRTMAAEPDWMLGCSYGYGILASGLAFQQVWHHHEWRYPGEVMRMAPDPTAPYRRGVEALGCPCEVLGNGVALGALGIDGQTFDALLDEPEMRARIVASIADHGRPVLALGVIGPSECGLVTGYDEGGDVLIGWSYFQGAPEFAANDPDIAFEPSGYYRRRHWYPHTPAIIVLGERGARPPAKEALSRALAWSIALARTPAIGEYHGGLAALDAWRAAMADDAQWDLPWEVRRARYQIHNAMVGQIAEARWYAGVVLAHAAYYEEIRPPEHLLGAASCCAAGHRLMWDIWNVAGGIGDDDDKVRQGTTSEARVRIASLIAEMRAVDARAIAHLERALAG